MTARTASSHDGFGIAGWRRGPRRRKASWCSATSRACSRAIAAAWWSSSDRARSQASWPGCRRRTVAIVSRTNRSSVPADSRSSVSSETASGWNSGLPADGEFRGSRAAAASAARRTCSS